MRDIEVTCKKCNKVFVIRQFEQDNFTERGKLLPQYCPICHREYCKKKEEERKKKEDLAWKEKKAIELLRYYDNLNSLRSQFDIITLEDVEPNLQDKVLYVIGNGFDLMHGVRSSYYDFGSTLGKNSDIRITLENYLEVDDLWADFEGALAKINVEAMSQPYILDNLLDVMGTYEEDAQAADFFAAAEMAASPATELSRELKNRFTK